MQVAATDIGDERDLRLDRRDVGEILLRPDAEVDPAGFQPRRQLRGDGRDRVLVGQQIVGRAGVRPEVAVRLGDLLRSATRIPDR